MNIFFYKRMFWFYVFFVLWSIAVFWATRFLPPTPLGLMFATFFIVLCPGFLLSRIFRINLDDGLGQIILWLTLGLIFSWALAFLSILLGLTISVLTIMWLLMLAVIFFISFVLETRRPPESKKQTFWQFKNIFQLNNLVYLLVFFTAFLMIMYLVRNGSLFKGGDPSYHLAIVRKVIGDQPLTIPNLNYVRSTIHLAYGFPIWHIFLGLIVKITRSDMFVVWRDISSIILIMVMLVWYWLGRQIFPNRGLAVLAFLIFATFTFYGGPGWFYSTLPIPHSLTQFLLLPLTVGLGLTYVFDRPSLKLLIILLLLVLFGTAVHITLYFYFLTIMVSLTLFYLVFSWAQTDFKKILRRVMILIGLTIAVILPLALLLELNGSVISTYFKDLQRADYPTTVKWHSFGDFTAYSLYAYVGLPIILFFIRRYQKLIFLLAVLSVAPLVYFTFLRVLLTRLFGFIYVKRLYTNLNWNFLVWALVVGFVLILINRFVVRVGQISRRLYWILNILIGLAAVFLFYWQEKTDWAGKFWQRIFKQDIFGWLSQNYSWLMVALFILAVFIFILQIIRPKFQNFFNLEETKEPIINFFIMSILFLILIAPNYSLFKSYFFHRKNLKYFIKSMLPVARAKTDYYGNKIGGAKTVEFINTQIPAKSVFDSNVAYFYLPIIVDQHMPIYSSLADTEHLDLYADKTILGRRLEILRQYNIDYLLVKSPKNGQPIFETLPQYFEKIFQDKYIIYKVNKTIVKKDGLN